MDGPQAIEELLFFIFAFDINQRVGVSTSSVSPCDNWYIYEKSVWQNCAYNVIMQRPIPIRLSVTGKDMGLDRHQAFSIIFTLWREASRGSLEGHKPGIVMADFKKILIANRGEIAIRVMRAANELGKRTVAIYAEEDKLSLHRFKADEAYRVGAGMGPVAAYLSISEIIRVAKECDADAIHPGYGLLSENPEFVDACTEAGITFIGPKAETMRKLGDKASARKVAIEAGVPVIPATEVLGDDMEDIAREAAKIGYPLMLKASWGGGGSRHASDQWSR